MSKQPAKASSTRDAVRDQVVKAARDCFRHDGVRATTMEGIAKAAGVSRQTVYKIFATRLDLVGASVADRISELADNIEARGWADDSLVAAFVGQAGAIVEAIRDDGELAVLLGQDSPLTLHQVLWQPAIRQRGLSVFQPWLRQARRAGLIRSDATDNDVYDWIQTVLTSIILRPDADPAHQRHLIEVFLVDSLRPRRDE